MRGAFCIFRASISFSLLTDYNTLTFNAKVQILFEIYAFDTQKNGLNSGNLSVSPLSSLSVYGERHSMPRFCILFLAADIEKERWNYRPWNCVSDFSSCFCAKTRGLVKQLKAKRRSNHGCQFVTRFSAILPTLVKQKRL